MRNKRLFVLVSVCLVDGQEKETDDSFSPLCSSTDVYLLDKEKKKEHVALGWLLLIISDFIFVSCDFFFPPLENIKSSPLNWLMQTLSVPHTNSNLFLF